MNPGGRVRLTRRAMILGAGAALLSACSDDQRSIVIAGGSPDGDLPFTRLLAGALTHVGLPSSAKVTSGSEHNRLLVTAHRADMGMCSADVLADYADTVVALATVHRIYLHLVVRADSDFHAVEDLTRARIGVPLRDTPASKAAIETLIELGVGTSSALGQRWVPVETGDGAIARAGDQFDALLWAGGISRADLSAVRAVTELRALDLSRALPTLRTRGRQRYDNGMIPASTYGQEHGVQTVVVPNLLVCRPDLDAAAVGAVVDLITESADKLVPATSGGTQYLNRPTLIDTSPLDLHPAAVERYRVRYG